MAYIVENDVVVAALTKQLDRLSGEQSKLPSQSLGSTVACHHMIPSAGVFSCIPAMICLCFSIHLNQNLTFSELPRPAGPREDT